MTVTQDAAAIAGDLVELRHAIHREPEVGLHLPLTQQKILAALDGLPLEVTVGTSLTSVTAVLRGGRTDGVERQAGNPGADGQGSTPGGAAAAAADGGPVVLLRSDMDALPVTERTGLEYASGIVGAMHACGHDLHMAMLVGAARLLSARRAELPGSVVFMFQPGEEGYGGAKYMIEEGVLDAAGARAAAAYALHVTSARLPTGVCSSRPGPMMAAADVLEVTVRGHGGHASQPHNAADPIPAACEMVTALQTMVTRGFDIFDPVVITVGSFHAGTTDNVIPDEARFLATLRTFSPAVRQRVRKAAVRLVTGIADGHGLSARAEFGNAYPVTVNDEAEAEFAQHVVAEVLGEGRFQAQPNPMTGSEDFSFVLEQVPGAFVMLGACPPGADPASAPYNHSADAVFDDSILADGATLYAELALRRLSANST
ncbi:MAG TPA: M20 family metallopeptidase [Streptosporangiaceae bacterium]